MERGVKARRPEFEPCREAGEDANRAWRAAAWRAVPAPLYLYSKINCNILIDGVRFS